MDREEEEDIKRELEEEQQVMEADRLQAEADSREALGLPTEDVENLAEEADIGKDNAEGKGTTGGDNNRVDGSGEVVAANEQKGEQDEDKKKEEIKEEHSPEARLQQAREQLVEMLKVTLR